jgi:hypothetical protein
MGLPVVQLPNGRFALAPHLFLKFVYQQYDIKKLNGEMAFSSTAMWWRIFRRWYSRQGKALRKAGFSQNAFRDLSPKR